MNGSRFPEPDAPALSVAESGEVLQLDLDDLDAISGGNDRQPTCTFWCSGNWTYATDAAIW
jgi:hypothetical protein